MNRLNWSVLLLALTPALGVLACASGAPAPKAPAAADDSARPEPPPGGGPDQGPPPSDEAHRAPPEAAFTACTDKKEGDICTAKHEKEELTGTCRKGPPNSTDERLSCMPKGEPGNHDGHGGPDGKGGKVAPPKDPKN